MTYKLIRLDIVHGGRKFMRDGERIELLEAANLLNKDANTYGVVYYVETVEDDEKSQSQ